MQHSLFDFETQAPREEPTREDGDCGGGENAVTGFSCGGKLCVALTVVGQIEGHIALPAGVKTTKYEHVIPKLLQIEQDDHIAGLLILLNTVGGDVEAGLALSELISGMKKPTVSLVLGGGHSIGVPLAVSAKRSFIVPTATMTLHPVRMNGTVLGVPQTMDYFRDIEERIVSFVTAHSGISAARLKKLMRAPGKLATDLGTILRGQSAVSEGIIDGIGSLSDAVSTLSSMLGGA